MEIQTKTRTEQILTVMLVLTWVAFIGLLIEAGAILLTYGVSLFNPEASSNLYNGLDLHNLKAYDLRHYTLSICLKVAISAMQAYVCYLLIKALSKVNLANPFTADMARILEKISYVLLETWIIVMIYNGHCAWLLEKTGELKGDWDSGTFIFMAGLVFIMSQIFKRGVEIQTENDLTV